MSSDNRGRGAASALFAVSAACVSDEETAIMWITIQTNILIGHIVHMRGQADDYHLLAVICILPQHSALCEQYYFAITKSAI